MEEKVLHNPKIEDLSETKLVGFRVLCDSEQYLNEIPKAAQLLNERMNEIQQVTNSSVQYGAFVVDNYSEAEDGYWICVQVNEYEDIPDDMVCLTIPPQRYAVGKHNGANYSIRDTYARLHAWIEKNGYERQLDKWHLERYHSWNNKDNLIIELLDTITES